MLPYLTFTTTKVKIKLPSYFFPNPHGWIYFFENLPGIFHFFSLPPEIPDKTKLNSWLFHKIVLDPQETPRPKTKTLEISHYFLLVTVGNSTLFLIAVTPGNSTCYFFDTPGNSISSNSPVSIFFWNSPMLNAKPELFS